MKTALAPTDVAPGERRDPREWTTRQRRKNDVVYALVRAGVAFAAVAPPALVRAACAGLALAAWAAMPTTRRRVRARLRGAARPESSMRAFLDAGATLAGMAALFRPNERARRSLTIDDASRDAFRSALDEGRGVVFVSAHLGPWERMAALLVEEGFPVATVARESYDPRLTACVYERLRAARGVRSIYLGDPRLATGVVRELVAGRAVGFLVDLPGRVESIAATLFAAPARLPVGPARVALARRAAVVVGTAPRGRVTISRVATADLAPGAEGEAALLARIAAEVDRRITGAPTEWLGLFAPPIFPPSEGSR
ncbi:MAG TPA: lysophospholipid acyltransferase family protein [Byssovorax sp.]